MPFYFPDPNALIALVILTGLGLLFVWRPAVREEFYRKHIRPRRAPFTYTLGSKTGCLDGGEIRWLAVGISVYGRADFPPHVGDRLIVRSTSGDVLTYRIQLVHRAVRGTEFWADVRPMTGDEMEAWE